MHATQQTCNDTKTNSNKISKSSSLNDLNLSMPRPLKLVSFRSNTFLCYVLTVTEFFVVHFDLYRRWEKGKGQHIITGKER